MKRAGSQIGCRRSAAFRPLHRLMPERAGGRVPLNIRALPGRIASFVHRIKRSDDYSPSPGGECRNESGLIYSRFRGALAIVLLLGTLTGCRQDMFEQPKSSPMGASDLFDDRAAARPIPPHTVARGEMDTDEAFYTGMIGTNLVTTLPFPVTLGVLQRGRECFQINCVPCHGETGEGDGIVVQRGFPAPPSYHLDRLRHAPIGHFFDVITRGYGVMYPYASRISAPDRWAIAAYIRALQLSEHATLGDVPTNELARLEKDQ